MGMEAEVADAASRFGAGGRIAGALHASGVLHDALVGQQSAALVREIYAAKAAHHLPHVRLRILRFLPVFVLKSRIRVRTKGSPSCAPCGPALFADPDHFCAKSMELLGAKTTGRCLLGSAGVCGGLSGALSGCVHKSSCR